MPKDHELIEEFGLIGDELYQLLLSAFCYRTKLGALGQRLRSASRRFLLEEMISLRLISNEIVLQLCKLDDDDGNWTLRTLRKEAFRHLTDKKQIDRINRLLKEYRTNLNELKTKHRNAYIAHRNVKEYPNLANIPNFEKEFQSLICDALEVFECLRGSPVEFGFKLGSQERFLDLKHELMS